MCEAGAAGPKAATANARAVRSCLRPARARRSSASQGGAGVRAYDARRGGAGVAATSAAGGGHVRLGEHALRARERGERGVEEKKKYEPFIFHLPVALSLRLK